MIEARGLSKRFQDKKRGEIRAVDNVSFTCQPGKIYGLLRANPPGKTTTLRMLATLVHHPSVMIFDEPTNGLDIMTARTIAAFIRECRDSGKTVIFSTHIMSEVEKLCDLIGIIHDGKLLTEGTLAQLRDKYAEHDLEEIFVKVVTPHYLAAEAN